MQGQIFIILTIKVFVASAAREWNPNPQWKGRAAMAWIDGRNREPGAEIDTFYDRVIAISKTSASQQSPRLHYYNEVTGVFITNLHVLTSFNAFKIIAQSSETLNDMRIIYLQERLFNTTGILRSYHEDKQKKFVCARQVIPSDEMVVPPHMQHGAFHPQHDLMVIRLDKAVIFLEPVPPKLTVFSNVLYEGEYSNKHNLYVLKTGPILTNVATAKDQVTENLEFVSLGHINDKHMKESRFLEKEEVFSDDDVITDCDEWFPREWGHFVCLRNVNNFVGIASGGLLFSEQKLIGVGAFALWRGKDSILVFTDVRPYAHLLFKTCTEDDQNLVMPKDDL